MAGQDSTTASWSLAGNGGTGIANFLGTTDNKPFFVKVNNLPAGFIDNARFNTTWGYNSGDSVLYNPANAGIVLNTGIGYKTLSGITEASELTAIGANAVASDQTGDYVTGVGANALRNNTTGYYNTAVGAEALTANTTGTENMAFGAFTLTRNTTGSANSGMGGLVLENNTTGRDNTAMGDVAMSQSTTGSYNTAIGSGTMNVNTTGNSNTSVGYQAQYFNNAGAYNASYGYQSMYISQGSYNTCYGPFTLYNNSGGNFNTGLGYASMYSSHNASYNSAVGPYSLYYNTSGTGNTAMGYFSMWGNTTGNYNTGIGYDASVTDGVTNATAIGNGAFTNASNKVRIGNSAVTVIEGQVPFTTPSDGRYKYDVQEDVKGLDFILQLRPVTYRFDVKRFDDHLRQHTHQAASSTQDGSNSLVLPVADKQQQAATAAEAAYQEASAIRRSGFIAQEVERAAQTSGYNFSGIIKPKTDQEHYSLSYESFVVPLVKAVQEQQRLIQDLQKEVSALKEQLSGRK